MSHTGEVGCVYRAHKNISQKRRNRMAVGSLKDQFLLATRTALVTPKKLRDVSRLLKLQYNSRIYAYLLTFLKG